MAPVHVYKPRNGDIEVRARFDNPEAHQPTWREGQPVSWGDEASSYQFADHPLKLVFNAARKEIAVAVNCQIQMFSIGTDDQLTFLYSLTPFKTDVQGLLFTRDGKHLLAHADEAEGTIIWDLDKKPNQTHTDYDPKELALKAMSAVGGEAMAKAGWLAKGFMSSQLCWHLEQAFLEAAVYKNRQDFRVFYGIFSEKPMDDECNILVAHEDNRFYGIDLHTMRIRIMGKSHERKVTWAAPSPDGRVIASASWDKSIVLWDCTTGKALHTWRSSHRQGLDVFSSDSKLIAVSDTRSNLRVFHTHNFVQVASFSGFGLLITSLRFMPDDALLACADDNGEIHLLAPQYGQTPKVSLLVRLSNRRRGPIMNVRFICKGQKLTFRTPDGGLLIYDLVANDLSRIAPKSFAMRSASLYDYNEELGLIGTCDSDKMVRLWKTG